MIHRCEMNSKNSQIKEVSSSYAQYKSLLMTNAVVRVNFGFRGKQSKSDQPSNNQIVVFD